MADLLDATFDRRAALRVSAAGLGGRCASFPLVLLTSCSHIDCSVSVHVCTDIQPQVVQFFEARGWKVRCLHPGPPTELMCPTI